MSVSVSLTQLLTQEGWRQNWDLKENSYLKFSLEVEDGIITLAFKGENLIG